MEAISTLATPTETLSVVARDPDDNRVLECAIAAHSEFVVTGDADLLSLGTFRGIEITTVAAFLEKLDPKQDT